MRYAAIIAVIGLACMVGCVSQGLEEGCAMEGERFSQVYTEYPEHCCVGLTEWDSGFDTSISIADECYETGLLAGSPIGTCINCGNMVCEDIENPCNCPEDCVGKSKSDFLSIEEFCQGESWSQTFSEACEETIRGFPLCELCVFITTEPVSGELTTQGYVYDDELGYGFEYPDGWEFYINVDKDVEQCDPLLYYEDYNCVDFPDENIKKVVSFEKKISITGGAYVSVEIELTIKSAADLQEVKSEFIEGLDRSGIPILNETAISVNNTSGYDILSGTPSWKLRQVVFFANGTAYVFKYSSQDEFYREYEEIFDNIINSFVITSPN